LAHARKEALAFWKDARKRCEKAGLAAGSKIADEAEALIAPDAPPKPSTTETPEARLWILLNGGDAFERARTMSRGATKFLLGAQEPQGYWNCAKHGGTSQFSPGVTGLAVLAVLTADGSELDDARREAATKAVDWLIGRQSKEGRFGYASDGSFVYSHAVATRAVAAWVAATGEREKAGPALEKAADYIAHLRNPDAAWRYGKQPGDNDTSVTYWMVAALQAVRELGMEVDAASFAGAHGWVKHATCEYFRAGYNGTGTGPARPPGKLEAFPADNSESLTAAACLIRHWCGERDTEAIRGHFGLVGKVLPTADPPDMYYWHLGAKAYAVVAGKIPTKWYEALVTSAGRCRAGDGSFDPDGPWGGAGGRIYSTAVTSLALMAPLEVSRSAGRTSASDFLKKGTAVVAVPISPEPRPTGIYVDEGMQLTADPTGTVQYCPGVPAAEPGGMKKDPPKRKRVTRKGKFGCLMGQIGRSGKPFVIRRKGPLKVKGCGQLYVFVNATETGAATGGFRLGLKVK
ncbi:MAG: prenyltransferase/squalene oxidase repeat-containing protein, partial [Planctomycetota bacterium]